MSFLFSSAESKTPSPAFLGKQRGIQHHFESLQEYQKTASTTALTLGITGVNVDPNRQGATSSKPKSSKSGAPQVNQIERFRLWNTLSQAQPSLRNPLIQTNKPYYICETVPPSLFVTVGAVPVNNGTSFSVNAISQIGSLQNIFDQYRITRIEVWVALQPVTNSVTISQYNACNIATAIDYDSNAAPSSLASLCDYENVQVAASDIGHYHSFSPKIAMAAYGSGVFASYTSVESPWIDATSSTVEHYGLLIAASAALGSNPVNFWYRLHTEWRALR